VGSRSGCTTRRLRADWPTRMALSSSRPTTEGVRFSPIALAISRGPDSVHSATAELVVPRSIPMSAKRRPRVPRPNDKLRSLADVLFQPLPHSPAWGPKLLPLSQPLGTSRRPKREGRRAQTGGAHRSVRLLCSIRGSRHAHGRCALALLWQIFSGTGFPNQFFNDSCPT